LISRFKPQDVGWVSYVFHDDAVEWEFAKPAALRPVDVTDLLDRYGALRFVPAPPRPQCGAPRPRRGDAHRDDAGHHAMISAPQAIA
jgi:hypothetical protein